MVTSLVNTINIWKAGALAEVAAARALVASGNLRQALFWGHLALEKALKAHVVKTTEKHAPFTHSLPLLAHIAQLSLSDKQRVFLDQMNGFQVVGRYDDPEANVVFDMDASEVADFIARTEEMVEWLVQKLSAL